MFTNQELYDPFENIIENTSESIEDGEIKTYNCSNCGPTEQDIYKVTNQINLCLTCYNLYKQHLCYNCDNIFIPSKLYQIDNKQICENCYDNYINKIFGYECFVCKIVKKNIEWRENKHGMKICKKCYKNSKIFATS